VTVEFVMSVAVITPDPAESRKLFEVEDEAAVQRAAEELRGEGYELLHDAKKEPWRQTVARLQSSEGAVIGISFAPSMHD
jgi:hypothetical protein